jgi:hypothetical protein
MLIFTMELLSSIHHHLQKTEDIGIMKLLEENDSIYFSQDIQPEIEAVIYRNPSETKRKLPPTISIIFLQFLCFFFKFISL